MPTPESKPTERSGEALAPAAAGGAGLDRSTMVFASSALLAVLVMPAAAQMVNLSAVGAAVGFFFTVGAVTAWRNGGCGPRDLLALAVAACTAALAATLFAAGEGMSIPRGIYLLGGVMVAGAAEYLTWRMPAPSAAAAPERLAA